MRIKAIKRTSLSQKVPRVARKGSVSSVCLAVFVPRPFVLCKQATLNEGLRWELFFSKLRIILINSSSYWTKFYFGTFLNDNGSRCKVTRGFEVGGSFVLLISSFANYHRARERRGWIENYPTSLALKKLTCGHTQSRLSCYQTTTDFIQNG